MDVLNSEIYGYLGKSSMIRRMFEAGIELRKKFGDDNVYDFSLGNPDLPPPESVADALAECAKGARNAFSIGYMPNAGYPELRKKLASKISIEQGVVIPDGNVVVTCGAAGGLNVFLRAVLERGDEVVVPSPYFVEYDFYVANFGGKLVKVQSRDLTFELDIRSIADSITPRTRAVILNSPNNPTGVIYSREELECLAGVIAEKQREYGRPIYVIADEPYRFLNFDNVEIPSVVGLFDNGVVIGSFSKNLSLAGERLGYIAVSPKISKGETLVKGLVLCNRILGFVNAPAIGQQILLGCLDSQVDLEIYRSRRNAMAAVLDAAGLEYHMPRGAFYFFVKSPVDDEHVLVNNLLDEHILVVPGSGFGRSGYVRIAFCVSEKTINNSRAGFIRACAITRGTTGE